VVEQLRAANAGLREVITRAGDVGAGGADRGAGPAVGEGFVDLEQAPSSHPLYRKPARESGRQLVQPQAARGAAFDDAAGR
jgi:hypothetical protein